MCGVWRTTLSCYYRNDICYGRNDQIRVVQLWKIYPHLFFLFFFVFWDLRIQTQCARIINDLHLLTKSSPDTFWPKSEARLRLRAKHRHGFIVRLPLTFTRPCLRGIIPTLSTWPTNKMICGEVTDKARPEAVHKECVCDPITLCVSTSFSNPTEEGMRSGALLWI